MATRLLHPRQIEFYNRFPENFLLVENHEDGGVVIRAARNNYSERRKALFIHELAAEGFIPDEFQFMTNVEEDGFFGVRWVIDSSWLVIPQEIIDTSHRRTLALVLAAFVVVVIMIAWLIIGSSC